MQILTTAKKKEHTGIEPRTDIFFFDSYGLDGLKHFIIQDDKEMIDKTLIGIDKMDRIDKKNNSL